MSVIRRIAGIILQPGPEWEIIAREPATVGSLTLHFLLPLALITPFATVFGMLHFDASWNSMHGYSVAPEKILSVGIGNFAFIVGSIFILAGIFHWFAPSEKPFRGKFLDAYKVAVYGSAPLLLAGIGLIMPIMIIVIMVALLHSLFLYYAGIMTVLRVHELDAAPFVAMALTILCFVSTLLGAAVFNLGIELV